ncbi:MAG TPA: hypothetical protein VGH38_28095 [Bryobacteraceae bacterium]|jgi:hypothetical protein
MSEWLELELAEQLAPVAAPDDLWDRVEGAIGRPAAVAASVAIRRELPRWPIAAIVTLMVAAATLWLAAKGQEPAPNLAQLAQEELLDRAPLDLRSSDPGEIGAWMRQHAGVSVSLPTTGKAHLSGVRLIRKGGTRIAAVEYAVGSDAATLLVARVGSAPSAPHGLSSWSSGGQCYALACSNRERPETACLLCHASL